MTNSTRLENLEPPKLGCLPIRTILIVFSVLGLISSPSALFSQTDPSFVGFLLGLALNGCVLYGTLKYHDLTLMISQKLLYSALIVNFIMFCTIPVIIASYGTSGYFGKVTMFEDSGKISDMQHVRTESEEFMGEMNPRKAEVVVAFAPNLNMGLMLGFAAEIVIGISSAAIYLEVVMIKRFRQHAVAWREGKAYEQIP